MLTLNFQDQFILPDIHYDKDGNENEVFSYKTLKLQNNGEQLRDPEFLVDFIKTYNAFNNFGHINESILIDQLSILFNLLDKLYPELWDIFILSDKKVCVGILFPEITISNSVNQQHFIKNLMVILPIDSATNYTDLSIQNILGTRLSLSLEEWNSGYMHSHLYKNIIDTNSSVMQLSNFCLGSSEILEQLRVVKTHFDIHQIELFLLLIKSLVEWESLEGTPYILINSISLDVNSNSPLAVGTIEYIYNKVAEYIYSNVIHELQIVINEGKPEIILSNEAKNLIKAKIIEYIDSSDFSWNRAMFTKTLVKIKNNKIIYYGSKADYSQELFNSTFSEDGVLPYTVFRGVQYKFDVQLSESSNNDINTYSLHPNLVSYIQNKLTNKLYVETIRKNIITGARTKD